MFHLIDIFFDLYNPISVSSLSDAEQFAENMLPSIALRESRRDNISGIGFRTADLGRNKAGSPNGGRRRLRIPMLLGSAVQNPISFYSLPLFSPCRGRTRDLFLELRGCHQWLAESTRTKAVHPPSQY